MPGERADQGRSALDFRVEQDSETKEDEPRTFKRTGNGKRRKQGVPLTEPMDVRSGTGTQRVPLTDLRTEAEPPTV